LLHHADFNTGYGSADSVGEHSAQHGTLDCSQ
jgi:hypothetical protein